MASPKRRESKLYLCTLSSCRGWYLRAGRQSSVWLEGQVDTGQCRGQGRDSAGAAGRALQASRWPAKPRSDDLKHRKPMAGTESRDSEPCLANFAGLWLCFPREGMSSSMHSFPSSSFFFQFQFLQLRKDTCGHSTPAELAWAAGRGRVVVRESCTQKPRKMAQATARVSSVWGQAPGSGWHSRGSPVGWGPCHGCRQGCSQQGWLQQEGKPLQIGPVLLVPGLGWGQ